MKLLITVPKSGTHLFRNMMNAGSLNVLSVKASRPRALFRSNKAISTAMANLDRTKDYCFHLPFSELALHSLERFEWVGLLLRDPRDILISMAYHGDKSPKSPMNYPMNGKRMNRYPLQERFDWLLENFRPFLMLFEPWRLFGLDVFFYEDCLTNPRKTAQRLSYLGFGETVDILERSAMRYTNYRTGAMGNWKTEFSEAQKYRACEQFGDLIEAWS